MKGTSGFAAFALTTAVLGVMIGLALRSGYAQSADSSVPETSQAYLPIVGLTQGGAGIVHVVNLSADTTSPAVRFNVLFVDAQGAALKPAVPCDLQGGQSCSVPLSAIECGLTPGVDDGGGSRCEFRAVVSTDGLSTPPGATDVGASTPGTWSTTLETTDRQGRSLCVSIPLTLLAIPTQSGTVGTDGGTVGTDGGATGGGTF